MKKRIFLVANWKKNRWLCRKSCSSSHEMKNNNFLKIGEKKKKSNQGDKRSKENEMESMEDIRDI